MGVRSALPAPAMNFPGDPFGAGGGIVPLIFAPQDLLVSERRYPDRVGQTYRLQYNPAHQWYYFPEMRRDEALVFKVFDSKQDGRARFVPHTSFENPLAPADALPRRSIEIRTIAFFDEPN